MVPADPHTLLLPAAFKWHPQDTVARASRQLLRLLLVVLTTLQRMPFTHTVSTVFAIHSPASSLREEEKDCTAILLKRTGGHSKVFKIHSQRGNGALSSSSSNLRREVMVLFFAFFKSSSKNNGGRSSLRLFQICTKR